MSNFDDLYNKYRNRYLKLQNKIGGAGAYSLNEYNLFDKVMLDGKEYLIINKNYLEGNYTLVDEQTQEQIKADEEMLKLKEIYTQNRQVKK